MQIVLISTTGAIRGDESPAPLSSPFQPTNESYLTLALAQPTRWHSHQLVEDSITCALSVLLLIATPSNGDIDYRNYTHHSATTQLYTPNGPAVSAEANVEVTPVASAYSTVSASFMVTNKRYKPSVSMAATTIMHVPAPTTQPSPTSHTAKMTQLSQR